MLARDLPGPGISSLVLVARDLRTQDLLDSAGQGPPGPQDLLASSGGADQEPPFGPLDLLASAECWPGISRDLPGPGTF